MVRFETVRVKTVRVETLWMKRYGSKRYKSRLVWVETVEDSNEFTLIPSYIGRILNSYS
ncbi:hypothetical protein HanIR_Chr04g0180131 [Helianthus annuus]|nr:hypothetical protein HanIR_Chr04g0180131 [Helianthus annuus]